MKLNASNRYAHHAIQEQQHVQMQLTQQKNLNGQNAQVKTGSEAPPADLADNLSVDNFFGDLNRGIGIPSVEDSQKQDESQQQDESKQGDSQKQGDPPKQDEEKQKKPDEERPIFEKKKTDPKPNKDESIEIVRQQRDEYKKQIEELTNGFGEETKPQDLLDLHNAMKDSIQGPMTKDAISNWLKEQGASKAQIKEIQEQLVDYKKKLESYDINNSEEFQKNYLKPAIDARDKLLYTFAVPVLDAQGKETFLAPKAMSKLNAYLNGDPAKLSNHGIQSAIREYQSEFKKETNGEDPPNVNLASVLTGLREYHTALGAMNNAKKNWAETKEKDKRAAALQAEQQQEAQKKQSRRERVGHYTTAYKEYDHDSIDGILEPKVVEDIFQSGFDTAEKFFNGEAPYSYVDIAKRGADADIMAHLRESGIWAEMVKLYKEANINQELKGSGGNKNQSKQQGTTGSNSFLGEYDLVKK